MADKVLQLDAMTLKKKIVKTKPVKTKDLKKLGMEHAVIGMMSRVVSRENPLRR